MSIALYYTNALARDLAAQLAALLGDNAIVLGNVTLPPPPSPPRLKVFLYMGKTISWDEIITALTSLRAAPVRPIVLVLLHRVRDNNGAFIATRSLRTDVAPLVKTYVQIGFFTSPADPSERWLSDTANTAAVVNTIRSFLVEQEDLEPDPEPQYVDVDADLEPEPSNDTPVAEDAPLPGVGIPYNMKIAVHTPPMPPLNHVIRFKLPDIDVNTTGRIQADKAQACQWFVRSVDILQALHSRGPELRWEQTLNLKGVDDDATLYATLVALCSDIAKKETTQPLVVKIWLNGGGFFVFTRLPGDNPADPDLAEFQWHFQVEDNNASLESVLNCGVINHRSPKAMYLHTLPAEFFVRHAKPLLVKTSGLRLAKLPYTLTLGPVVSGRVQRYALHSGMARMRSTDGSDRLIAFVTDYWFQRLGLIKTKPTVDVYEIGADGVSSFLIPSNTFLDSYRLAFTHWRVVYDEK